VRLRGAGNLDVRERYDTNSQQILLTITNRGSQTVTSGWYDLAITVEGDTHFEYRVAGHLENGEDSSSDPLMGGLV